MGVEKVDLIYKKNFIIHIIYYLVIIGLLFVFVRYVFSFLLPFIIAFIIAFLVQKPAYYISRKTGINKRLCATIFSLFFYVIFLAIIVMSVWLFINFSQKTLKQINVNVFVNRVIDDVNNFITRFFYDSDKNYSETIKKIIDETINGFIKKASSFVSNLFTDFIKNIPNLFLNLIITIVATSYISKDFDCFKKFIYGIISEKTKVKTLQIKDIFVESVLKISVGYFWLYLVTFAILFVGFMIMKIPNLLIVSLIVALVDLMPVLGTGTILLPWAIFEFLQHNFMLGFYLVIVYLITIVTKNILEPKVIGKQIGINPLFTLIFIFLGYKIAGLLGIILLPISFTVFLNYYRLENLKSIN